jgi:pyruvate,water dikinase
LADAVQALPADRLVALLRSGEPPEGVDPALWQDWGSRFQAHLDQYGHAVYNLDFVNAVPADDPGPLLETLRFYLGENSGDPYERQRQSVERRERAVAAVLARVDPIRGATFSRLLRWAQAVAPIREDALADVGLAWPQLRRMMVELGRRLVRNGAINQPEQVFWLREDEVRQLVSADGGVDQQATLVERIEQRKMVWRGQRLATPPQLLPEGTWIKYLESWMPAASANQTGDVIKGTGASAGQVTATARVLEGPHDFARMQPGDILVTSITTPAWTTLFALAAGVVTDVGGPLSHSSIVAREYGIPAVLGTGVATRRIRDGQRIRVDGDAGTITLLEDGDDNATDDSAGHARPAQLTDSPATDRLRRIGLVTGTTALVGWLLVRRHRRRQRSDRRRQTD